MTYLTGMRLRNWTRYRGLHEVELGPGTIAITAVRTDDPERSNYTGKTAVAFAPFWCLYGRTELGDGLYMLGKRTLDELCSHGESDFQVDLQYSDGAFISRVKRRGHSTDLMLETSDGRQLTGDGAQDEIDRLIAGDREDALSTWYAVQRRAAQLVTAKSSDSTAQIESWLGLERLVVSSDIVDARFTAKSQELYRARSELAELERLVDTQEMADLEQAIADAEREVEEARQKRESAIASAANREAGIRLAQDESELLVIRDEHEELKQLGFEAPVDQKLVQTEARASDRVATARNRLVQLKRTATGEFDGTCPVSQGFVCPAREQINGRRTENRAAVVEAERDLTRLKDEHEVADTALAAAQRLESDALSRKESIAASERHVKSLEARIEAAKARGVRASTQLPSGGIPPEPDQTQLVRFRLELERRQGALESIEDARQRVVSLEREHRVIRASSSVLGPEGARKRAVMRAVQEMERAANQVIEDAGVDLTVQAQWGRELGKAADQCGECGAAFPSSTRVKLCVACGTARGLKVKHEFAWKISDVSGASEDMVGVVLRCAAFRRLQIDRPVNASIAVLDEPAAHFDRRNRKLFATRLRRILEGTFEQAFVTAHSEDVLAGCSRRLVVVGNEKWSRLEIR